MFSSLVYTVKGNYRTRRIRYRIRQKGKYFIAMSAVSNVAVLQNPSGDLFKNTGHWTLPNNYRIRTSGVGLRHLYFLEVSQNDPEYQKSLETSVFHFTLHLSSFIILETVS